MKLDGWADAARWQLAFVGSCVAVITCLCFIASENWRVGWKIKQARADYDAKLATMQGIIDAHRPTTNVVKIVWGGRADR